MEMFKKPSTAFAYFFLLKELKTMNLKWRPKLYNEPKADHWKITETKMLSTPNWSIAGSSNSQKQQLQSVSMEKNCDPTQNPEYQIQLNCKSWWEQRNFNKTHRPI